MCAQSNMRIYIMINAGHCQEGRGEVVCVYVGMYLYIVCVYVYVCMCLVCMYVCMYVCM